MLIMRTSILLLLTAVILGLAIAPVPAHAEAPVQTETPIQTESPSATPSPGASATLETAPTGLAAGGPARFTLYIPAASSLVIPPAPPASTTYYVLNTDPAALYQLGCQQAQADAARPRPDDTLVILDFGQGYSEKEEGKERVWGTWLFSPAWRFISMDTIAAAARGYIQGYWACAKGGDRLTLGIGTNNYGGYGSDSKDPEVREAFASEHGRRWAQMVASVASWSASSGYATRVTVVGANDIELSWNPPNVTRAWVASYTAVNGSRIPFYNFGACEGCPTVPYPTWKGVNGWTQEDVWYAAWGAAAAWPLPEIYLNTGIHARQWQQMSWYSATRHGLRMDFVGAMTQQVACQQRGGCTFSNGQRMDNPPDVGWRQLYEALFKDPLTRQTKLRWSTDIRWMNR